MVVLHHLGINISKPQVATLLNNTLGDPSRRANDIDYLRVADGIARAVASNRWA